MKKTGKGRSLALLPRGLKEKLILSFVFMSVCPMLVIWYALVRSGFPRVEPDGQFAAIILLTIVLATLGFLILRNVILPVARMVSDARAIAGGEVERDIQVRGDDEIADLGASLSQITEQVRSHLTQLRDYGEQTHQLNLSINRKTLIFSDIFQISSMISQSAPLAEVTAFLLERLTQMEEFDLSILLEPAADRGQFEIRRVHGPADDAGSQAVSRGVRCRWLEEAFQENLPRVSEGPGALSDPETQILRARFGVTSMICQPLSVRGRRIGLLLCGSRKREPILFPEDSREFLKIFGRQLSIAMEKEMLSQQAKALEILDDLTGVYNLSYIQNRLEEEIQRAVRFHRPCALALFELADFSEHQQRVGLIAAEKILKQTASAIQIQIGEVDRLGRIGHHLFGVIFPERSKREATELARKIQEQVQVRCLGSGAASDHPIRLMVGVSENPLDGESGSALFERARQGLGCQPTERVTA